MIVDVVYVRIKYIFICHGDVVIPGIAKRLPEKKPFLYF